MTASFFSPTISSLALLVLLAGCSGGGDASIIDAAVSDVVIPLDSDGPPPIPCDFFTQNGCDAGQRCAAWRWSGNTVARVACAPQGTATIGTTCARRFDTSAPDNCIAGSECINGICVEMCDLLQATTCPGDGDCTQSCLHVHQYPPYDEDKDGFPVGACMGGLDAGPDCE